MTKGIKVTGTIASRVFPKLSFGALKDVDQFIERGVPQGDNKAPDREFRWWVDTQPFSNLTLAREHVINTLGIEITEEIRTNFNYTPAYGWKKAPKGEIMRTPQTVQEVTEKMDAAKANLAKLQTTVTKDMTADDQLRHNAGIRSTQDQIRYYERCLPAAKAGVTLKTFERQQREAKASKAQKAQKHDTHTAEPVMSPSTKSTSQPEAIVKPKADPVREPYTVAIKTPGGSEMSIQCSGNAALDSVFSMIKKYEL